MKLVYTLALITQTGLTDLAQFDTRDACMKEAQKVRDQKIIGVNLTPTPGTTGILSDVVCVPKTQHTDQQVQQEIDRAMALMKYMMSQLKDVK